MAPVMVAQDGSNIIPPSRRLKAPAARHYLAKVRQRTVARPMTTVIEPGVDVAADVAAIRAGQALRSGNEFVVNGRTYGIHDGTLYPISGPGFHRLRRPAFKALGIANQFGDTVRAAELLDKMRIADDERAAGCRAWEAARER